MRQILAIDPGPNQSAIVYYEGKTVMGCGILKNEEVLAKCHEAPDWADTLVVEGIACYGMPVGAETFDTCIWIGRFIQAWGGQHRLVYRHEVKSHLCRSTRAKDANIRQALIDKFGGKEAAIGKKKTPGPLYGIKSHCWAALAVAVTAAET